MHFITDGEGRIMKNILIVLFLEYYIKKMHWH